jgi:hypothetical protein
LRGLLAGTRDEASITTPDYNSLPTFDDGFIEQIVGSLDSGPSPDADDTSQQQTLAALFVGLHVEGSTADIDGASVTRLLSGLYRLLPANLVTELVQTALSRGRPDIVLGGDTARQHFNLYEVRGIAWGKGAAPCFRDEADRRVTDPSHPWYRRQPHPAKVYKALNALIQGTGARQAKLLMLAGWREGIAPLLMMHDGVDFSVASSKIAERVAQLGAEVMKLRVPMRMDLTYGRNWADATYTWAEITGQSAAPKPVEATGEAPDANATPSTGDGASPESQSSGAETAGAEAKAPPPPPGSGSEDDEDDDEDGDPIDDEPAGGSGPTGRVDDGDDDEPGNDKAAKSSKPFDDAPLKRRGYQQVLPFFNYALPDGTLLYQKIRYELRPGIPEVLPDRPRKTFRVRRQVNGIWMDDAGERRVPYNWMQIICASRRECLRCRR